MARTDPVPYISGARQFSPIHQTLVTIAMSSKRSEKECHIYPLVYQSWKFGEDRFSIFSDNNGLQEDR